MSQTADYPRELPEAHKDARYGVVYHQRNASFYRRIRWAIAVIQLVLTSAALAPLLSDSAGRAIPFIGLGLAVLTIVDIVSDFAGAAAQNAQQQRAYADLLGSGKSLEAFDKCLRLLEGDDIRALRSLEVPAYNSVVRSIGRADYVKPTPLRAKLADLFA